MRIAFYMPFKSMGHANPSGDLIIGTELFEFLTRQGHQVMPVSHLRARWIYWKPWHFFGLPLHLALAMKKSRRFGAQLWLTYHTYYKAPDLLGPICASHLNIPYAVFQGIYATKYRRKFKTLPGFWLNRKALRAANLVLSNKRRDYHNLRRILPYHRLKYVPPGILTNMFTPCSQARRELRRTWDVADRPVIITAAMFRPGVKTEGLRQVINACGILRRKGHALKLIIVGDGDQRRNLMTLARERLPGSHLFLGKVPRRRLYRCFSAADLFAFPGIEESLGMVYLEAQACGLPVVAHGRWGASEAVVSDLTGILVDEAGPDRLAQAIGRLIEDPKKRQAMGCAARRHVLNRHDLAVNYQYLAGALNRLID